MAQVTSIKRFAVSSSLIESPEATCVQYYLASVINEDLLQFRSRVPEIVPQTWQDVRSHDGVDKASNFLEYNSVYFGT